MKRANTAIFLDSSFAIANQIINDDFNERTSKLLADFRFAGRPCWLTPLVLDEFLYIINRNLREVLPANLPGEVSKRVVRLTKILLTTANIFLVNPKFTKSDMLGVPHIMSKYDLRPRDAMIVKSMQILGVKDIASFDSDFDRVKGINVIK